MSNEELKQILRLHQLWLNDEPEGVMADFRGADLRGANLSFAILTGADLTGADLRGADLYEADLYLAILTGADLRGANLREANFIGADLREAKIDFPMVCPASGSYIAYKAASGYIVKLEIPEDAKRCSATTRKCRASKAKVLAIENPYGTDSGVLSCNSYFNHSFVYTIGETVSVDDFDPCRWNECSTGIHHFMEREEAVKYLKYRI